MHEIKTSRYFIPKNPRLVVAEGFYNKANNLRDAQISIGGLELFKKWFSERKLGTPLSNVWEFDIGKLVVLGVFFDNDFLVDLAKKYDHITRFVKNYARENIFRVYPELISEVFNLNPNHIVHEIIDMDDLQARYDAHRVYLRLGPLQQHFTMIGTLPLVTPNTPEPLMRK